MYKSMKEIYIKFNQKYKSYNLNSTYRLEGDLIVISGVNGSGKSQLLKAIANPENGNINRELKIIESDKELNSENVLLLSFRDNINIGSGFGQYNINFRNSTIDSAYSFYQSNIFHIDSNSNKMERFNKGNIIMSGNSRLPYWRSAEKLIYLLKEKYDDSKLFDLSRNEFAEFLPSDFVWMGNNNIVNHVSNLFYAACCKRANEQIAYSKRADIFNNDEWLKTAPWTILNNLFKELSFKYSFKTDYKFDLPNMNEVPQLRDIYGIRMLEDLSDGEKAILKLALIALDNENYPDLSLVLFDEYDATLNPSLIEKFYYVLENFFINNGVGVIIATHSPSTISLSPDYAQFYEIFSKENSEPIIKNVSRDEYNELEIANRTFYNKIKDQNDRIMQLEKMLKKPIKDTLYVEDEYCQIYKIAFLKLKNITEINEDNFDTIFDKEFSFCIEGGFGTGGLYNRITSRNISEDNSFKSIYLFDFDEEGVKTFNKINGVKFNNCKMFLDFERDISKGYSCKHVHSNRYALLLPIPDRLKQFTNLNNSKYNYVEIENLLPLQYIKNNPKFEKPLECLEIYELKDSSKKTFWKELFALEQTFFYDFKPLLDCVQNIFAKN